MNWTDAEIEEGIVAALKAKDIPGVEALLSILRRQNPDRAGEVVNAMKVGMAVIRRERTQR